MRILVSNDDGVHAPALKILAKELKKLGRVWVVAPMAEKSTSGHSLTLHKPLRMIEFEKDFYGVTGSPADCVYLGIRKAIKKMPDLVVSGINRGANLGQDVYYSGTVSAAREGCILGLRSIAVSLCIDFKKQKPEDKRNYLAAAKLTVKLIQSLKKTDFPHHTMLNLNVPDLPLERIKGMQVARQGHQFYSGAILQRKDHRGRDYYWVGGTYKGFKKEAGTDTSVVNSGYAALTPLKLDCTDQRFTRPLEKIVSERF